MIIGLFSSIFYTNCRLKFNYIDLSGEVISIISIFLTIYILSLTGLVANAELSKNLAKEKSRVSDKSKLGLITTYYKYGFLFAILTLWLTFIAKLLFLNIENLNNYINIFYSFNFGVFSINFVFCLYILKFNLNFQLRRFS